jgi:hypothetical protein
MGSLPMFRSEAIFNCTKTLKQLAKMLANYCLKFGCLLISITFAFSAKSLTIFEMLDGEFIVDAAVTDIRAKSQSETLCTLKITSVRCGPADLKGKTFTVISSNPSKPANKGGAPALQIDEKGVWSVFHLADGTLSTGPLVSHLPEWLPLRPGLSDRRAEKELALKKIVELLGKGHAARVPLLKEYLRSQIPEIAAWAADLLADVASESDNKELTKYLRQCALDKGFSISARVVLDRFVCDRDDNYEVSDQRLKAFEEMGESNLSSPDLAALENRMRQGRWIGDNEQKALPLIAAALINNSSVPREDKTIILSIAAGLITTQERAVEYLLDLSVHGRVEEIRAAAAAVLAGIHNLSEKSKNSIAGVLPLAKDVSVAQYLSAALTADTNRQK